MLLNRCCYTFVFHTFVKTNNKNATVVLAMGSPTRSNNALKQAASPSFHCRHSNVKLQHCSICFPLVFSRSWMNLRCSTVNPSQAKTWQTTVRILPLFWEGIEVLLSNLSAVITHLPWKGVAGAGMPPSCWFESPLSQRGRTQCKTVPTWRRNPKRPQGLDGKRRIVNFMNWRKCCRYRRQSPPSWIKPP